MNDGKLTITRTGGAQSIEIDLPIWSYKSSHKFAIDISQNDDGTFNLFDNYISTPGDLDQDFCDCTFLLTKADVLALDDFYRQYRNEDFTLSMLPAGFYPFFPHRGNVGPFTVAMSEPKFAGFQEDPWKLYKVDVKFSITKANVWPSFSFPSARNEGPMSIAGVSGIRYPDAGFQPTVAISKPVIMSEDSTAYYNSCESGADFVVGDFPLQLNTSKAIALFDAIFTARASSIALIVPPNYFPFGENAGDNKSFSCYNIQETIEIVHEDYDTFTSTLKLWRDNLGFGKVAYDIDTGKVAYDSDTGKVIYDIGG